MVSEISEQLAAIRQSLRFEPADEFLVRLAPSVAVDSVSVPTDDGAWLLERTKGWYALTGREACALGPMFDIATDGDHAREIERIYRTAGDTRAWYEFRESIRGS